MKKNQIKVGNVYVAKVSGQLTDVRIDRESTRGGWLATNLRTGRTIHLRTAGRLRGEANDGG